MKKKSAMIQCRTLRGHLDWVWGAVHLPDGQHIITCSADGSLRLWDLESCTQIGDNWQDEDDEQDEGDEARVLSLALSPNGTTVASGSSDGTVRLWDVKTGEVVGKWRGHTDTVWQVCWSPDGERVAIRYSDRTVRFWDIESRKCALLRIKMTTCTMAYSPDGKNIAIGGHWLDEYGVKIWDPKTAELLFTVDHDLSDSSMAQWSSDSQSSLHWILLVSSLVWTSDGKKLVSGSSDGSIRIFDTATWQLSAVLLGHTPDHISSFSLAWNDRLLASASYDTTVRLWDLDTNLPVGPPLKHKYYMIGCAAFSADGKLLVTCCEDENAYVWDVTAIKEAGHNDLLSIPEVSVNILDANPTSLVHPQEVIEDDPKQKVCIILCRALRE